MPPLSRELFQGYRYEGSALIIGDGPLISIHCSSMLNEEVFQKKLKILVENVIKYSIL
jgi:hypothetical protein